VIAGKHNRFRSTGPKRTGSVLVGMLVRRLSYIHREYFVPGDCVSRNNGFQRDSVKVVGSRRLSVVVCTVLIGLCLGDAQQASAQSPSGKGDTPSAGKAPAGAEAPSAADRASASLQFAMAAFRRMMGDLDVKDVQKASTDRDAAVTQLALAATMYNVVASQIGGHKIEPVAHSTQQACDSDTVRRQAAIHDVKLPSSQQDLLIVTGKLVEQLHASIEKFDVATAAKDARARQTTEQQVDSTLLLLSCVTAPFLTDG
jgi:hypothetical protein